MKKKIVAMLVIAMTLMVGCVSNAEATIKEEKAFEVISTEKSELSVHGSLSVIRYKETGQKFVLYTTSDGSAMAPLD